MKRIILLALLVLSVLVATSAVPAVAASATCGDAIIQAPNDNGFYEQCDEGTANGDECEAGVGETCSYCSWRCTVETVEGPEPTYCGDGDVQKPNTNGLYEQCDEGTANTDLKEAPYGETVSYCTSSCQQESSKGGYCGDGICQSDYENAFTCATDCAGGGTAPSLNVDLWANPTYVAAPATVTYSCSAAFGETPYKYTLSFGDGESRETSSGPYGTHVYDEPGDYTMRCTVEDADGTTRSDSELITVIELDVSPIASFTANETELFVGDSFRYTCEGQSGNGELSYETFFGDGATTGRTSGTHSYSATGTYTAGCTVTDEDGDFDTDTETIRVIARPDLKPTVSLDAAPTSGDAPLYVNYSCTVSGGDAPVSSSMSFGDGSSSNTLSGLHRYDEPGVYSLSCSATDVDGDSDDDSVTIEVKEPYVDLEPLVDLNVTPTSGHAPLTVDYACSVSGGNAPLTSRVSVGSSSTSALDGEITFDAPGTYEVVCSATDVDGDSDSDSVTVNVKAPIEALDVELIATPQSGDAPLDVDYACLATGGVFPYTYSVSFGDSSSAPGANGDHTYDEPGTYVMTCTVEDARGMDASHSATIEVKEPYVDLEPSVELSADPTSGYAPLEVDYSCDVSGGNAPVSASLDFGDGSTSNVLDSTHTYDEPGYYTMTCSADDADGDVASDSVTIKVKEPLEPFTAKLDVDPMTGIAPLEVDYACSASGGVAPYTYSIAFDDGASTSDASGSYVYPEGTFWMTCTARDADGRKAYASTQIVVESEPVDLEPTVELSAEPTWGYAPMDVNYSCDVSGGDAPVSVSIDFGDGSSSTDLESTHTYDTPGYYTMTCTATDVDGDTASDSVSLRVKEPVDLVPEVVMSATPTSGEASLRVNYSCDVSGGDAPVSTTLMMNGIELDDLEGLFVFIREGEYTFTCSATDADGDSDSDSVTITVHESDLEPTVELSAEPTWGYAPMDVNYACDVSGGNDPVSTIVEFGDGSSSTDLDAMHTYDTPGYYTMTCTATDVDGDTASDSVSLRVKEPVDLVPEVSLDVSPTEGEAPLTVDYACTVSGGDAPVTSSVSVGSSSTSALDGEITFDVPGSYDVVCEAVDSDGDSDSDSVTVTVHEKDVEPVVELTAEPIEGYAPLDVDYSCDVFGGNAPVYAEVLFGDGSSDTSLDAMHTYSEPGTYTMTCQAQDADGDADSDSLAITVLDKGDGPYDIEFSATPDTGVEPFTTTVACSVAGGVSPIHYVVEYADADIPTYSDIVPVNERVEYTNYGVYDLTCTATDAFGRSIDADERVVVLPDSPVDITPDSPSEHDDLSCEVTEYPDATFAYEWYRNGELVKQGLFAGSTLDASETSVGDVVECIAYLPGTDYEVGRDAETIRYSGPSSIEFDVSPNEGEAPLEVSWTCDVDGGAEPVDYLIEVEWNGMSQSTSTATGMVLVQPANYTFTCTATDANGDEISAQEFVEVTAKNYDDDWSISANPRSGPAPLTVVFDANASDIPIVGEVRWDFADGLEGLGAPIAHTFPRVGSYVVTAYATLDDGRVLEKDVTIIVTPADDEKPEIDMDRVRIQHTYAEIVGDTLYGTVTVRNDAGTTIRSSTASVYLPDLNTYAQTEMPRIRDGEQETVQFFVELDDYAFDPIAVFVVQNEQIRLQDATIVLG